MKIALIGYGKMGREIEKTAIERGHEICARIDNSEQWSVKQSAFITADVALEFSTPDAVVDNLKRCFDNQVPVVCGTTGWLSHLEYITGYCNEKNGTLFYASNFSIGVNIFFEINKLLATLMREHPEYGIGIEEVHHIHKLDAPSGTAITLAHDIMKCNPGKTKWVNQATNDADTLSILSERTGTVPGTHAVHYESSSDNITITHSAYNRSGFVTGALSAAEWVKDKKGVFTMKDFLNL